MKRLSVLFILCLMLCLLPQTALGAGEGAILVDLKGGGKPISGAEIQVFLAGKPSDKGYRLSDAFGGGMITQMDVFSPELAVWLSQRASGGWKDTTDSQGRASFYGLDEGLYLVMQPFSKGGYRPFEPFLITIPWDGIQWEITATPKTEREITVVPDTSDPGIVNCGILGMLLSGTALLALLLSGKKRR